MAGLESVKGDFFITIWNDEATNYCCCRSLYEIIGCVMFLSCEFRRYPGFSAAGSTNAAHLLATVCLIGTYERLNLQMMKPAVPLLRLR